MNHLFHTTLAYIKWFPKTFHLHGIHSPFIYTFEKRCLRGKASKPVARILKSYRQKVLENNTVIEVLDFGAGSRVFKDNHRKVSDIARHAGASQKRTELLSRIVEYFEMNSILELGTSLGIATAGLASRKNTQVTTLEGCPSTAGIAMKTLDSFNINNAQVIVNDIETSLKTLQDREFDLIYFDSNHSKEATLNYARQLLPSAHNNTIWIFDDIHWSKEMTEAWKEIQQFAEITATIDGFWFGIVFFRLEQLKEEFQIRLS